MPGPASPVAIVGLAVLALLLLAAVAYVLRTRRSTGRAPAAPSNAFGAASGARVPPAEVAGSPWPGGLPPHIRPGMTAAPGPASPPNDPGLDAAGRVSFGVGMTGIQREEGSLQVLWHGINDGSVPVAVQWGRPEVRVEGDRIEFRYVYDMAAEPGSPFRPPRARPLRPDEIVSRTAQVSLSEIGRDPAGMTVQVFVAFGPAAELAAAQSGRDAYLSWQQITYTRPRIVPKA